jgi:oligogalacturonide transport system substrate-binding protein
VLKRRQALAAGAATLATPWVLAQTPKVLRFAWWGGAARHAATLKAIALFEQKQPGLKIKAEYMGFNGYLERLTTQVAGGSEPDVMQINWAWLAMFSKRGTGVTDLDATRPLSLDQFSAGDLAWAAWPASSMRCRCPTPRACCCGTRPPSSAPAWRCPTAGTALFAAGPAFRKHAG